MRVALHVGQIFQPVPGGIGRYVEGLLGALPHVDVDVVPFAAVGRPFAVGTDAPGIDLGFPSGRWRYEMWHRVRRPRCHLDADVLHAPSLAIPPPYHMPLVVTVHDLAFLRYPETFTAHGAEFHRRGLEIAHREAAAIVTASRFARDELLRCGFDADRVHLAPHGVTMPAAPTNAEADGRVAALGIRGQFVLTVGTIEPRKGLTTLTDAFERVHRTRPDVTLVVVGPTGWGRVPGLERPGVHRVGQIADADLDALYRRAAVCAVPSLYEGFGLPALEAMSRGGAVVASDASSLPEVVGDAGRLVPPRDVDAWADTLLHLLDDPVEHARCAQAGRERARRFTWLESARAHRAAYDAAAEFGRIRSA